MPRIKVWKLRDPEKQADLSEVFKAKTQDSELSQTSSVDVRWTSLKDKLLQATKQVCGVSSNHPWRKQTWWWNNQVEEAVREKRRSADALSCERQVAVGLHTIQPSVHPIV